VLYRYGRHRVTRILGLLYPALTLFAIVVTANHYFLDAVGGAIIIGVAAWILRTADRRKSQKAVARASGADLAPAP
jgi:membrane-associated phospholipid phosphatase